MRFKFVLGVGLATLLVGCSTLETQKTHTPPTKPNHSTGSEHAPYTQGGVKITPYNPGEITRTPVSPTVVVPKQQPIAQDDGSNLTAFKQMIGQAQAALKQQQYAQAERLATQAQRISPQAAQSYVVLAQSALAQKQLAQAKSLAQRGLSLASDASTKNQLLQIQQQATSGAK